MLASMFRPSAARAAAPRDSQAFSQLMFDAAQANTTLLKFCYPTADEVTSDVRHNWVAYTSGCEVCRGCYCFHVKGDMKITVNPEGWKTCARLGALERCKRDFRKSCNCFRAKNGGECLFSDMRPTKVLAAITAARLAGVTHIIEEGRFGGLTAMLYAHHGFRVTSIEFLPLDGVTRGLQRLAPNVEMINGDGSTLVPAMVENMTDAEAQSTMVVFDGEKRTGAYETFRKISSRVAVAIFDDSNMGADSTAFAVTLRSERSVWWDTRDVAWTPLIARESVPLQPLQPLRNLTGKWHGGVNDLQRFHFAIVRGGGWL